MDASDLKARLDLARRAAREAGLATLEHFQQPGLAVERKGDDSPVTIADREAEQIIRVLIGKTFPGDGIIGEEFGRTAGESAFTWVLDPIDGTKTFICGVPLYSSLIGILHEERSVAGVIRIPALDEAVFAAEGMGAWHERPGRSPAKAKVSARTRLEEAVFIVSQVDSFEMQGAGDTYRELERRAAITRTWGDGYGYLLVATGRADVMVDPIMNVWDAAAILPVIVEAGGRFTDWREEPTVHSGQSVATNGLLHDAVMKIVRG